ncbi:MAG: SH3 domain-containing protein [Beijerinckiaceae bacterium]
MRTRILAVMLGVLAAGNASPAQATAFCDGLPTRDGFVALRDAPSANGKLVRRMKSGESVQIDSTVRERNGWMKVFYVGADRSLSVPGWVNRRLVERECG